MTYTKDFLLGLYEAMFRIRQCEEAFVEPILNGEIRTPAHLYSGEEAVAVGVAAALEEKDYVFGTHRSHGHYLAKGGSMRALVAEVFCRRSGCARGRGGSMHVIASRKGMLGAAPIVAGTVSLAVGAALTTRVRGDGRVSVSFFGDGAMGEGVLYESMNLASLWGLPVVFVCENNLYSTHMPIRECRPPTEIYRSAESFGIEAHSVDGNDAIAVFEAAAAAVGRCRSEGRPAFLECSTYRLRGHVGPDDNIQGTHTDIRPSEEYEEWKKRDPVLVMEKRLLAAGVTQEDIDVIRDRATAEVSAAFRSARDDHFPEREGVTRYVFA